MAIGAALDGLRGTEPLTLVEALTPELGAEGRASPPQPLSMAATDG